MQGAFFLAGLVGILWLAYWIAMEGREPPGTKPRWSPFDWIEDAPPPPSPEGATRPTASWRDRARQSDPKRNTPGRRR